LFGKKKMFFIGLGAGHRAEKKRRKFFGAKWAKGRGKGTPSPVFPWGKNFFKRAEKGKGASCEQQREKKKSLFQASNPERPPGKRKVKLPGKEPFLKKKVT